MNKKVFRPKRETISKAIEEFLIKGGRITTLESQTMVKFSKPYRSPKAIDLSELPMEFL